jgi:hypothetical protein
VSGQLHAPDALPPGKDPPVPIGQEAYKIKIGKPEGYRPLGEPNLLKEVYEGVDWIHLAQDRDQWRATVSTVRNPSGSINGVEFLLKKESATWN